MQLGDLTGVEKITEAILGGYGEVFFVDTTDFSYTRDEDESHDAQWVLETFEQTRAMTDSWKKIGLDEQYLFFSIVADAERGTEAVLRIPRWEAGMTSGGHMALFKRHPLYPVLRETLDMAQSLVVRKQPDGFLVSYATKDGGRVRMDIHASDTALPENATPEEERDFFERNFENITSYAAGTYAAGVDRERPYYAIEQNYGETGHTFLETKDGVYVIDFQATGTRDLFLTDAKAGEAPLRVSPYCSLFDDGVHDVVWRNFESGGIRLSHEISDGLWFDYTLYPSEKASGGYSEIGIAMREGEGGVRFETGTKETVYTFRDINDDGYDDLTLGTIDEEDHGKERNFLFHEGLRAYVEGPKELEGKTPYRFEPETGYCLVGNEAESVTLYAFDDNGAFHALRKLERTGKEGSRQYQLTALEGQNGEEQTLLVKGASEGGGVNTLFTSVFLWQGMIDPDPETEDEEPLRVIVTRKRVPDIIDPYDAYRVFVMEDGGSLFGYYEPGRISGPLRDIATEYAAYGGVLTRDSAIVLYAGEEEEPCRIEIGELLKETGYE